MLELKLHNLLCIFRYQSVEKSRQAQQAYGPNSVQPELPSSEVRHLCNEYKIGLKVCIEEINSIEEDTKNQGDDPTGRWYLLQRCRLTSSNFGVVCKRRESTPVSKLVKSLLYHSSSLAVSSLRWGIENENNARRSYADEMAKIGVKKVGLIISHSKPYLACSLDDFVEDESVEDRYGTVEYKCPYSARELTPVEACKHVKGLFCKIENEKAKLKLNHNYHYQVQGVLGITKRKWCDFVVWTPKGTLIERIYFNPAFWENMLPKLESFYDNAILPELAAPQYPHQPIREPGSW